MYLELYIPYGYVFISLLLIKVMDIGSAYYSSTEKTILNADFQNFGQSHGN